MPHVTNLFRSLEVCSNFFSSNLAYITAFDCGRAFCFVRVMQKNFAMSIFSQVILHLASPLSIVCLNYMWFPTIKFHSVGVSCFVCGGVLL